MNSIDTKAAAKLLGGEVHRGNNILCPGPGHSRKDRSLSVTFHADGFTVNSFAGDDFKECRDHVKDRLGWIDDWQAREPRPGPAIIPQSGDERARTATAMRLWESSAPITDTPAEVYLASRGLAYDGQALRYRPADRTMVALMTDAVTGAHCGVHRTYLDDAGRKLDRKMLGIAGVVRLYDWEGGFGVGIAEGIETALAADFRPMWSCLTAGGIERLPVLPWVEALTIFADHDASGTGQRAAVACAERWHAEGIEVTIKLPADVGEDYADRRAA